MENGQKTEPILKLPHGKKYAYLIPAAISVVLTLASIFGRVDEPFRVLYIIASALMACAMAFLAFLNVRPPRFVSYIVLAVTPTLAMFLLESTSHNPFEMAFQIIILNLLFFYIITGLSLSVTRRTSVALIVPLVYALLAGVAEHYVLKFRSAPLLPWDFKSIGIAATVAMNYDYEVKASLAASVSTMLLLISAAVYTGIKIEGLKKLAVRISSCVLSFALLCGYGFYLSLDRAITDFGLLDALFVPIKVYARNGFTVSFGMTLRYVSVPKPDGYSDAALEEIVNEIKDENASASYEPYSDVEKPNIIVIMNESFSDLSALCDFETNIDYMPFIRSLSENTVKGTLHVSVLGGNTANTEFEFLTGTSMAFLPTGSIPYQQYIKSDLPTLASQLAENGYETLAIHPYNAGGWNRNTVYKWFGFDKMMFRSDDPDIAIPDLAYFRNYATDFSVIKYILSALDIKEDGKPFFTFNVTMQNHGGYKTVYEDDALDERAVTVKGLEDDIEISTYLSLLRETDFAIEYLIKSLSAYDEPTVLLFFGDHQPASSVSDPILKQQGVSLDITELHDREQYYEVPFFIWANYDIREETIEDISANYLSTLLCQVANIELTDMQKYLSELRRSYPTLTANSFTDSEGVLHPLSDIDGEKMLHDYNLAAYNYLFGGNTTGLYEYKRR